MRKRIVGPHHAQQGAQSDKGWFDLEEIATVEATSEDPHFRLNMHSGQTTDRAGALLNIGYTTFLMRPPKGQICPECDRLLAVYERAIHALSSLRETGHTSSERAAILEFIAEEGRAFDRHLKACHREDLRSLEFPFT